MFDGAFTADVIADLGAPATVTRRKAGTYRKGIATPAAGEGSTTTLEIVASIQPASGRELQRLPEGRRASETRRILTATLLQVGGQGSAYQADLVCIDGEQWEVQNVKQWPGYCDALAQRPATGRS